MAGAVGDICQVSLEILFGSIVMRNVWYYRVEDTPTVGYLDGLSTDFQSVVLVPYAASQTTEIVFNSIQCLNIFSGDVVEDNTPTPAAGGRAVSGDRSASFIAAMILMTRQNNRVRHGRKYIYAPLEGDYAGNSLASSFVTLMNNLAATFDDVLAPGAGIDDFAPVIVGRIPYTTPQGKAAYRLPSSQAEMSSNWSYVGQCRLINRTTTMNSRKFWKGE